VTGTGAKGSPADVANVAAFLASEADAVVTGQTSDVFGETGFPRNTSNQRGTR